MTAQFHESPVHVTESFQSLVRFGVKLELLAGLAMKLVETSARDRVKLIKPIWDFIGTEHGGRQLQYEMFYSAAQPVVGRRPLRAFLRIAPAEPALETETSDDSFDGVPSPRQYPAIDGRGSSELLPAKEAA